MKKDNHYVAHKVLILGNSNQINDINFNKLDGKITTIGVNRIWYKYSPNYLVFSDTEIYKELKEQKAFDKLKDTNIIVSEWIKRKGNAKIAQEILNDKRIRMYKIFPHLKFPDSVCSAIHIYHNFLRKDTRVRYYIAGVDLYYNQSKNHFWTGEYKTNNKHGKDWYEPRFKRMLENYTKFKQDGLDIVSVNPHSELNRLFPKKDIKELYV